jgi:transcription elongation factor GreA
MAGEMPITAYGMQKIKEELDHLVKVEREKLKIVIAEARELGDLKENAEYHSAKEKQSLTEGRISQLQGVIANSQIIKVKGTKSDTIVFGATVNLLDEDGNKISYQIVGADESDLKKGKISFTSPIGKALIGKEEGDAVIVKAPKGDVEYEIESFDFI